MHTFNEIMGQSDQLKKTWSNVLEQSFSTIDNDIHLFIGCGTSFYLACSAARYFQAVTGKFSQALPASEIFTSSDTLLDNKRYKIIAISRSGTTSEIIAALNYVKDLPNVSTLCVTCHENSPMVEKSEEQIILDHIKEKSVVMTQSFSNMLFALQLYAAKVGNSQDDLNELKQIPDFTKILLENWEATKEISESPTNKRFIFLGAGTLNGIAKEATLKLKEMTQTECESYSNLEFRHGPISIVDDSTVVVLLSQAQMEKVDQDLVRDIQKYGGKVLVIGPVSDEFLTDSKIKIESSIADRNKIILYVPHLQLLALHRAGSLGLNPDQPRNLSQVVKVNFS